MQRLQNLPGIEPAIAATLYADLAELCALNRKQIAALTGLAPHTEQRGAAPARAHIQGGRSCVRAALYMAALTAVRSERGFKAEYQAMRKAGKPARGALIAIARRIVVIANAVVKESRPWNGKSH